MVASSPAGGLFKPMELSEAKRLRRLEEERSAAEAHRGRTGGGHSGVEGGSRGGWSIVVLRRRRRGFLAFRVSPDLKNEIQEIADSEARVISQGVRPAPV